MSHFQQKATFERVGAIAIAIAIATARIRAAMPPFLVLLVNILVALTLLTVGSSGRPLGELSRRRVALAALPLLSAALGIAYVFGEDSYRDTGISRWDAYRSPGGALGPMFVVSVALMALCGALLALSGLRGSRRLFRSAAFTAGLTALLLLTPTIIGFSTN